MRGVDAQLAAEVARRRLHEIEADAAAGELRDLARRVRRQATGEHEREQRLARRRDRDPARGGGARDRVEIDAAAVVAARELDAATARAHGDRERACRRLGARAALRRRLDPVHDRVAHELHERAVRRPEHRRIDAQVAPPSAVNATSLPDAAAASSTRGAFRSAVKIEPTGTSRRRSASWPDRAQLAVELIGDVLRIDAGTQARDERV